MTKHPYLNCKLIEEFSRLGHLDAVRQLDNTDVNDLDIGNPNHPINDGIFGYDTKQFINKQYKETN